MGVSGCGKTAVGRLLADRLDGTFVDADDHHPPANVAKMRRGEPLNDADRAPWLDRLRGMIADALADPAAPPMVLACSALKRAYRDVLDPTPGPAGPPAKQSGGAVRFVFLDVDRDTLARRLADRKGHFFNPALLDNQLATLERPDTDEAWRVDVSQIDAPSVASRLAAEFVQ